MHASDGRKWIEGVFPDPETRRYCTILDAVLAIGSLVAPELFGFGAAAGAGALGAAEAGALGAGTALGGEAALGAGAGAGAALGGGEALGAGAGLFGGLGEGITAGLTGLGGLGEAGMAGLAELFGGAVPGAAVEGLAAPIAIEPLAGMAEIAAAPAAPAAAAAAPAVPASITPSAAAIGDFGVGATTGSEALGGEIGLNYAGGSGAGGGFLSSLVPGSAKEALGLAGVLGSGGMLASNLFKGNQPMPGEAQLNQAAGSLQATAAAQGNKGQVLQSFIESGELPPGLGQGLKTATAAAEASIRSQHARSGTSGSSAEAQDIQAAHERGQAAAAEIALKLLSQGSAMVGQSVNTENMAAGLYQAIMANALREDEALGRSIGNFSSALAGFGGGGDSRTITLRAA